MECSPDYARGATDIVHVVFTRHLERFVPCPPQDVAGVTVRAVLNEAFLRNPSLRPYVLDEQGAVRHHVAIFIDGQLMRDRKELTDLVSPGSEVYVMQSLSGG